uniref:Carbohydrate sulfotransferase n=1 Tax=Oryzias latipes TaxID=8090 RepID=A0A3P9HJA1_ORYLA
MRLRPSFLTLGNFVEFKSKTFFLFVFAAQVSIKEQKLRNDLLRKHCTDVNQSLVNLNKIDINNFIVDDKHGIIYCFVPKPFMFSAGGMYNWKRTLLALKHGEPYPNPISFKGDWVHQWERFQFLRQLPKAEREAKLRHYTKFLFVCDPFVRLISAYRDKILHESRRWRITPSINFPNLLNAFGVAGAYPMHWMGYHSVKGGSHTHSHPPLSHQVNHEACFWTAGGRKTLHSQGKLTE